jgi:hypothetical protein
LARVPAWVLGNSTGLALVCDSVMALGKALDSQWTLASASALGKVVG